ncbi:hypothetical protein BDV12DRAFT_168679 [Aspergillus spectabilis]
MQIETMPKYLIVTESSTEVISSPTPSESAAPTHTTTATAANSTRESESLDEATRLKALKAARDLVEALSFLSKLPFRMYLWYVDTDFLCPWHFARVFSWAFLPQSATTKAREQRATRLQKSLGRAQLWYDISLLGRLVDVDCVIFDGFQGDNEGTLLVDVGGGEGRYTQRIQPQVP